MAARWLIAAALMSSAALAQTPVIDHAPSAAILELRRIFFADRRINALTFRNMADMFHTLTVGHGDRVWQLDTDYHPLDFTYGFDGKNLNAEAFLERTHTNALIIVKGGRIVFERYRNFTDPTTHFLSMSTAKSITSILVGAAIQDGLIRSIDDQITAYVPELMGSAYDGVTIRNALMMRSGVDRPDVYDASPDSEMAKVREGAMVRNDRRSTDEALVVKRRHPPGKTFLYSTLDTTVLGWVIEKAAGKPLPDYMTQRLWQPLGAEAEGFFIADGPPGIGRATNGMGYNAVLRDYARIGLMMLNDGRANGRQIIPAEWVRASTSPHGPEPAATGEDYGYGYQWWTLTNSNAYMAIGLQGQFIFVDPDTDTVIVKLSYFPLGDEAASRESDAFFRAASAWRPAEAVGSGR